ncbi:hypothetical protein GMMP15_580035 [Candidatus Magnetomoraceae bacterium gMMP-15]
MNHIADKVKLKIKGIFKAEELNKLTR